ncbi:MAG: glutathione S-transferase family protein [Chakrabartia sp.]
MLKLIIGNKVYSSWSQRGWLAVKQSGLPFEEIVVPLYDDAWAARREQPDISPSGGKVPILWDGETPVWDSLAILLHLDALSGGDKFWPADPQARALALSLVAEMHSGFMPLRRNHPFNLRHIYPAAPLDPEVEADVARLAQLWDQARTRFGQAGPYLFGDFGAADIMFAPVVTRLVTYSIPVPASARSYMGTILAHPFMQQWAAEAAQEGWVIPRFERDAE